MLKDEQELVAKTKAVAEKRRKLPLGGKLKEDYVFRRANEGKVGEPVKFSELFGKHDTLLLYSFMFGPAGTSRARRARRWSMASIGPVSVTRNAAFVAIAKAPADRIAAWAKERGWSQIELVSGFESPFQADYVARARATTCSGRSCRLHQAGRRDLSFLGDREDVESRRHRVGVLEPDGLHAGGPAGPGTPPQRFRSEFLEKHYLGAK